MKSNLIIAIDFDNTIVGYDELLYSLALKRNLINRSVKTSKSAVRDYVRNLADGEVQWQKLQASAYGPHINEAQLIHGVREFLESCLERDCRVYIVSHKTKYAAQSESQINLRTAAMNWMNNHRFFGIDGIGINEEDVFFEDTRQAKIDRVCQLNCTHLIDDLLETFSEPGITENLKKILFAPDGTRSSVPGVKSAKSWQDITGYVFHAWN